MTVFTIPEGGKVVLHLGHLGGISGLLWHEDILFSTSADGEVLARTAQNNLCFPPLYTPNNVGIHSMAIAPKGDRLLLGTDEGIMVATLSSGDIQCLKGPEGAVMSVAWSASNDCMAGGNDGIVWVWDAQNPPHPLIELGDGASIKFVGWVETPAPLIVVKNTLGIFHAIALSNQEIIWTNDSFAASEVSHVLVSDSCVIAAGDGNLVRCLELTTGELIQEINVASGVSAISLTRQGFVTAHQDGSVQFWTPEGQPGDRQSLPSQNWINALAENNGRIAYSDSGQTVHITNPDELLPSIPNRMIAAGIDPTRNHLVVSDFASLSFWEVATGRKIRKQSLPCIRAVTFAERDEIITLDFDGILTRRSLENLSAIAQTEIQFQATALGYHLGKIWVQKIDNSFLALDATTLEIVEQPDSNIWEGASMVRRRGRWFEWLQEKQPIRAAFLPDDALVIWQPNRVLVSPEAEPFIWLWNQDRMEKFSPHQ